MSSSNSSTESRPTLPSIQHLLSDVVFNKLQTQPIQNARIPPATSYATESPFRLDSSEGHTHHETRQPWPTSLPGSQAPSQSTRSPTTSNGGAHNSGHHSGSVHPPATRLGPTTPMQHGLLAGHGFDGHSGGRYLSSPHPPQPNLMQTRSASALQIMAALNLPTYVLSADECPPDDDRRHGCGICHRRFNRPSSLRIHMNSHTGDQPFECPYPGCSRRFSVNSNMRRHYRNHREGHTLTPPTSYQPLYYQDDQPHMLYRMHSSPSSSSSMSSFGDSDDRSDTPVIAPRDASRPYPITQGRTRSVSEVYPPAQARQGARSRACTVPGCSCDEAPAALRPAFQQGSASRPAPRSR